MSKYNFLFKLPILIFVVSCSTHSVEDDARTSPNKVSSAAPPYAAQDQLKKNIEKDGLKTIEISNKESSDRLSEGIRLQDDELITTAATEVLTQNSKDVRALNALAMVHFKKGRHQAAIYLLNKAIASNGQHSELYNNLALVKLAQGEKREAIQIFRKGLEVNMQDAVIGANLGSIYVAEKDFAKAELSLEIPFKKGNRDSKVLNNYAITLTANGKANKAADLYEKLLKENPSQRDIMFNYSVTLIDHLQKYREGLEILNRLKFVGAPPEVKNIIKDLESKAKAGLK